MASFDEVETLILNPMSALYRRPPEISDPEAAKFEFFKELRQYDSNILRAMWEEMKKEYAGPFWPTLREFRRALRSVDDSRTVHPEVRLQRSSSELSFRLHEQAVRALQETEAGQRAQQEGLGCAFVRAAQTLRRLPELDDLIDLRISNKQFRARLDELRAEVASSNDHLMERLLKLGEAMAAREVA